MVSQNCVMSQSASDTVDAAEPSTKDSHTFDPPNVSMPESMQQESGMSRLAASITSRDRLAHDFWRLARRYLGMDVDGLQRDSAYTVRLSAQIQADDLDSASSCHEHRIVAIPFVLLIT